MRRFVRRSRNDLQKLACDLNASLPKSEKWFWDKWSSLGLVDQYDKQNYARFGFIADIINMKYKYVIEVDGSYHLREDQKRHDAIKDRIISSKGYLIVRVVAYDQQSFYSCVEKIKDRRKYIDGIKLPEKGQKGYRHPNKKPQKRARGYLPIEKIREIAKQRNAKPDLEEMRKRVSMEKLKKV